MTSAPLTDRKALDSHRRRARRAQGQDVFLHTRVRDEIEERLAAVNKTFTAPAIVTPYPDLWEGARPGARCIPDTELLDLAPGAHDLAIHALALHWADDPVGQLIQLRRALRADGLCLAALFAGQTLQELRRVLAEAETALRDGLSPRIAPMGEIRDLGALLQRAGFALPVADAETLTVTYRDLPHLLHDLRGMGETNALAARDRRPLSRAILARATALYAEHFPAPGGGITATFEIVFLTGWAPDHSQPKPLRPGSAAQRLADALGTEERNTGDPARPDARPGSSAGD